MCQARTGQNVRKFIKQRERDDDLITPIKPGPHQSGRWADRVDKRRYPNIGINEHYGWHGAPP